MPTLHLLMGLPGSGKSTLASTLESLTGAARISSDEQRLSLFPDPSFTQQEHDQLYDMIDHNVEHLLEAGRDVIYDANLNRLEHRKEKYDLAKHHNAKVVLWHVEVSANLARMRRIEEQDARLIPEGETSAAMFDRIADVIELPRDDEQCIMVDGTNINEQYISKLLATIA